MLQEADLMLFFVFLGAYSEKNRQADAGNPNVYHSIDDPDELTKVEHLYDEIKKGEAGK
jgi:hypothetical protein